MKIFLLAILSVGLVSSLPLNKREESLAEKSKTVPETVPAGLKSDEIHNVQDPNNAPEAKPETPSSEAKFEPPSSEDKSETPLTEDKSEPPSSEDKSETPSSEDKSEPPSSEAKSDTPTESESLAPESKPETLGMESKSDNPAPGSESKSETSTSETEPKTPSSQAKPEPKAPESKSEIPATKPKSENPAPGSDHKVEPPAASEVEPAKGPSVSETKHDKQPEKASAVNPDKKTGEDDPLSSLAKGLAISQIIESITKNIHKRSTGKQEASVSEALRSSEDTSLSSETSNKEEESSSSSEQKTSEEWNHTEEGKRGRALATKTDETQMDSKWKGTMGIPLMMRRRMTHGLKGIEKSSEGDEGEDEKENQGGEDKGKRHHLEDMNGSGKSESGQVGPADASNDETKKGESTKKLRRDTAKLEKKEVKAGELIITEKKPGSNSAESSTGVGKESEDLKLISGKTSRDFKGSDVNPKTAVLLTIEEKLKLNLLPLARRNAQMKLKETIAKMTKEAEFKSLMEPILVTEDEKTKTKTDRAILKSGKMQEIAVDSYHTAFVPENEKKALEEIKVLSQEGIKLMIIKGAAARTRGAIRMRRSDDYAGSSSDELLVEDMAPIRSSGKLRFAVRNRTPETLRLAVHKELPVLVESPKVLVKELPIVRDFPVLQELYGGDNILVREEVPVAVRESEYGSSEVRLPAAAPLRARVGQSSLEDSFSVHVAREHPLKLRKESFFLKSNDEILIPSDRQQHGRSYDQLASRAIVSEETSSYSEPAGAILKEQLASYDEVRASPAPIRISAETYEAPPASRYKRETMTLSKPSMSDPIPMIISGTSKVRSHMAAA